MKQQCPKCKEEVISENKQIDMCIGWLESTECGGKEKKFKPFKLVIIVESEEELISMWKRFNLCGSTIDKDQMSSSFHWHETTDCSEAWDVLNDFCIELGMR